MSMAQHQELVELVNARAQLLADLAADDLEAVLIESDDSDEELLPDVDALRESQRRPLPRGVLLAAGVVGMLSVGLLATLQQYPMQRQPVKANAHDGVELFGGAVGAVLSIMAASSHGMELAGAVGTAMEDAEKIAYDSQNISKHHDIEALINYTHELSHLHGQDLMGDNRMNDGNLCPDNEEVFAGLCYQKCSLLTKGSHPVRTTAFSCCAQEPCNAFNSVFTSPVKFCQGLDVGGRLPGVGCPHQPGDCLLNEEFHLGFCYKKCAILTNTEYPFRISAESCCKEWGYFECLEARNVMTNSTFAIGGGDGDKLLEGEAGLVHPPILALAEVQTTTTLWTAPSA